MTTTYMNNVAFYDYDTDCWLSQNPRYIIEVNKFKSIRYLISQAWRSVWFLISMRECELEAWRYPVESMDMCFIIGMRCHTPLYICPSDKRLPKKNYAWNTSFWISINSWIKASCIQVVVSRSWRIDCMESQSPVSLGLVPIWRPSHSRVHLHILIVTRKNNIFNVVQENLVSKMSFPISFLSSLQLFPLYPFLFSLLCLPLSLPTLDDIDRSYSRILAILKRTLQKYS